MIVVASRIASIACSRLGDGKFSKISSKLAPAARFSNSTPTGTRVPMNGNSVLFFIGEYRIADNTRSHFYAAGFTSR